VDIEQFYAENENRRSSAEYEYGAEWTDAAGRLYELSWIESTGELYLMAAPGAWVVNEPLFGDTLGYEEPVSGLAVKVVATVTSHAELDRQLEGWETAMAEPNSLAWLTQRVGTTLKEKD